MQPTDPKLIEAIKKLLVTLTPREEVIITWRFGFSRYYQEKRGIETVFYFAKHLGISVKQFLEIERKVIRKLRYGFRGKFLRESGIDPAELSRLLNSRDSYEDQKRITSVERVITNVEQLTPELIAHLRKHHDDLSQIPPNVFEHLVAELLASWGWDEVKRVGRNSQTSADILAGRFDDNLGERLRYYVEVKRWKNRIGIEIINQVLGAMIDERPRFGWHAAMIVTVAGAKEFRKYSKEELRLKGIWIKDRSDLERWIEGYKYSSSGLWLPS
jgi:hypothetical protein